jgi:endoglycosylceramidase
VRKPVRAAFGAVLLAILAGLGSPGHAAAGPTAPLSHEGRWITDASGRVVILHGWNMVYKVGSYRPEDTGFGADDMRFLRRNGFNTIRLGIIQNGVEPELPGKSGRASYREGYVRSIARTERQLSEHGIFTLLDVHQDLYNERFEGEGFPDWAVVGDAATLPAEPKQGFPANYLGMPALSRAFDHFWANDPDAAGRPLQDSFAAMWKHLAKKFRDRDRVLGYNLLNEPWPGTEYPSCVSPAGCPAFDTTFLRPFTERVLEAIRKVDDRKLVWYAPLLTFDFGADTSIGDLGDPNTGLAFNMYCLADIAPGAPPTACDAGYDLTLGNADDQAADTGDALLMTEYAATDDLQKIEKVAGLADEHMVGWQQWHYCDCDDPTTTGTGIQSIVSDAHKPPRGENLNRGKLKASSRPYPQVVAGTPERWSFDPESEEFELSYSARTPDGRTLPRRLETEVFIPPVHYHGRYRVRVEGATVTSRRGARRLRLRRSRGAKRVTLTVEPAQRQARE